MPVRTELKDPLERVRSFWTSLTEGVDESTNYYDQALYKCIKPLTCSTPAPGHPSTSTWLLDVQPWMCNHMGNLHGGAAATIFDIVTSGSLAAISSPGFWEYVGVSRSLNVTYLRPVKPGMKVRVTCDVLAVGKRMATVRGVMHETGDGEGAVGDVLCVCEHGKANIDPKL